MLLFCDLEVLGGKVCFVPQIAEILLQTMVSHRDRGAYLLHEFVIMPNHFHIVPTPSATTSLEKAVQFIKGGSSFEIHKQRGPKMVIWQEGFHDWTMRDVDDWRSKVDYIRMNPVRHIEAGRVGLFFCERACCARSGAGAVPAGRFRG